MGKRKKRPSRERIQLDILEQRTLESLREQMADLGRRRKDALARQMKKYLQHPAVFQVDRTEHHNGMPQVSINTAGAAKHGGFPLKGVRRYRLILQETLRKGAGPGPFHIARYTYAICDADTEERLFRFEYHPDLEEGSDPYSLIHHLHVERAPPQLRRVHFPIWPFLEQDDPHQVLELVLNWCMEELRRIDTSRVEHGRSQT